MRRPFAMAAWMMIAFVALSLISVAVNAGPWTNAQGYPVLMSGRGVAWYFCGLMPTVFAVILVLGVMGRLPGTIRRTPSCPDCGYDISHVEKVCPECGFNLPAGHTVAPCASCGYDMTGIDGACPECGRSR